MQNFKTLAQLLRGEFGWGSCSSCSSCYHGTKSTPRFGLGWEYDNIEIDKNVDISENENDEVINNDGYLYNNEELSKQHQPSDESNEIHFAEQCECGKLNMIENFKCDDCGKIFCEKCPDAPIGTNCLACLIVASGH